MQSGNLTDTGQELLYYRGRVALFHILKALDIETGDQVATQAFTCSAVPEGIIASGARPLYIDIKAGQVNMDPDDLARKIGPQTKAIIVQHTFGIPAEMNEIARIASNQNLPIIEDCCHVSSTQYDGKSLGTFGIAAFYSHEWGKPIPCGLGGSLSVSNSKLLSALSRQYNSTSPPPKIKDIRQQLQYVAFSALYRPAFFWHLRNAFQLLSRKGLAEGNYHQIDESVGPSSEFAMRMSSMAAKRLAKKRLAIDGIASHSQALGEIYKSRLSNSSFSMVAEPTLSATAYSRFPIWSDDKSRALAFAKSRNAELADWYSTPIHPFKDKELEQIRYMTGTCPNAELACNRILSLPTHAKTSPKEAERIASTLQTFT